MSWRALPDPIVEIILKFATEGTCQKGQVCNFLISTVCRQFRLNTQCAACSGDCTTIARDDRMPLRKQTGSIRPGAYVDMSVPTMRHLLALGYRVRRRTFGMVSLVFVTGYESPSRTVHMPPKMVYSYLIRTKKRARKVTGLITGPH